MENYIESIVVTHLKKLIASKTKYLLANKSAKNAAYMQSEILFLKNQVLPILLSQSTISYDCIVKNVVSSIDCALKYGCHGIYLYYPLLTDYEGQFKVGFLNSTFYDSFRTRGKVDFYIDAIRMDGIDKPMSCVQLPLNELI